METDKLKKSKGSGEGEEPMTTKKWLKKEMKINKDLLSIKLALFLFVGGVTCFVPYLTLHMQEMGMSIGQIGTIYAVLPVAAMIGPTLSGVIADKLGYYTLVLNVNIVICFIFHTMLLHVPYEKRSVLQVHCNSNSSTLRWSSCESEPSVAFNLTYFTLENCRSKCENVNLCFDAAERDSSFCTSKNLVNSSTERIYLEYTVKDDSSNCSLSVTSVEAKGEIYESMTCPSECPMICSVGNRTNDYDVEKAKGLSEPYFYLYFAIRIIATMALGSAFTMTDAVVLNKITEVGGDFGKQRMISVLSQAIMPLFAGILVDAFNYEGSIQVDYSAAFYLGDALLLIDVLIISRMNLKVEAAGGNVWKEAGKLLTKIEIDIFMITIIFLGSCWGFLETYLFVFLKFLGAPTYLLGLTLTVGSSFGLPGTFFSDAIVKKVGRGKIFFLSFIAYFIRFLGYSYIPSAWYCFPFEILEVLTYQVMWVAAATYCPVLAPANLLATMTGLAGAAHYSLGRGLGTFIGGYLIGQFGLVMTFRSVAYSCLVCGLLQAFTHKFVIEKKIRERKLIIAAASLTPGEQEDAKRNSINLMAQMANTSRRSSVAM